MNPITLSLDTASPPHADIAFRVLLLLLIGVLALPLILVPVPPMLAVMSVYTAGRIVLCLTLLLPALGTIVYSRAVLGVRSY